MLPCHCLLPESLYMSTCSMRSEGRGPKVRTPDCIAAESFCWLTETSEGELAFWTQIQCMLTPHMLIH